MVSSGSLYKSGNTAKIRSVIFVPNRSETRAYPVSCRVFLWMLTEGCPPVQPHCPFKNPALLQPSLLHYGEGTNKQNGTGPGRNREHISGFEWLSSVSCGGSQAGCALVFFIFLSVRVKRQMLSAQKAMKRAGTVGLFTPKTSAGGGGGGEEGEAGLLLLLVAAIQRRFNGFPPLKTDGRSRTLTRNH